MKYHGDMIKETAQVFVLLIGDGAVGLNIQEFDTMVRHNLPVVTVVLNNKAWGMCVHGQQSMFGDNRLVVTTLGESRYEEVAAGFGCHSAFVDRLEDIRPCLEEALASGRPACINLMTDLSAVYGQTDQASASSSASIFIKVDLPQPFAPIRP